MADVGRSTFGLSTTDATRAAPDRLYAGLRLARAQLASIVVTGSGVAVVTFLDVIDGDAIELCIGEGGLVLAGWVSGQGRADAVDVPVARC